MSKHHLTRKPQDGLNGQNGMTPAPVPTAQLTSVVDLHLKYDAVNDQIVLMETNLEGGRLDAILLSRITARLNLQALSAALLERDRLAQQVQQMQQGGKNGSG